MRIAVCDDQEIFREHIIKQCKEVLNDDTYYQSFESGECLLESEETFDLLFLDIMMTGLDGIQVKNVLEYRQSNMKIVFLTNYEGRMVEAFGDNVIGFLKKPAEKEELERYLRKVKISLDKKPVCLQESGVEYVFYPDDIRYIEAQDKYTLVMLKRESYLIRRTMKEWESALEQENFCRINRSFLVNFSWCKKIGNEIILEENKKIRVSRKDKEKIEEQYREYLKRLLEML